MRISASLLTFTLKQETVHDIHLFPHVMISHSAFHGTFLVTIIIKKIVFPSVVLEMTESLIQRQLNQYSATEHRICFAKCLPLAILNKKKNPCNIQTQFTELAVKIFIHCTYKCIFTILKIFLSCSCLS